MSSLSTLRSDLLHGAARGILSLGGHLDGTIRVQVNGPDGVQFLHQGRVAPEELLRVAAQPDEADDHPCMPPIPAPNPAWQWLSDIEQAIVNAASRDWQTARQLSIKAGYNVGTTFRVILNNLVERHILESGREGYRIFTGE